MSEGKPCTRNPHRCEEAANEFKLRENTTVNDEARKNHISRDSFEYVHGATIYHTFRGQNKWEGNEPSVFCKLLVLTEFSSVRIRRLYSRDRHISGVDFRALDQKEVWPTTVIPWYRKSRGVEIGDKSVATKDGVEDVVHLFMSDVIEYTANERQDSTCSQTSAGDRWRRLTSEDKRHM